MHFFAHSQVRSEVHAWLHLTVHSQPAWLTLWTCSQGNSKHAPKYPSEYVLKYTPGHAHQDTPNCTRWHTPSLLDCTLPSTLSRHSQAHSRACSQVHSQLHSMAHSQRAWLYAPKYALNTLSITLPIALDDTLPACLTIRSEVSSQDALNDTSEHALKHTPNCTRRHTPSLLDNTLPSMLSRCSQSHSRACSQVHSQLHSTTLLAYRALHSQVHPQEARHSQSHLTICSHVCSCMLDPETCWVADTRHWEGWGWWRVVGTVWRAVGGVRRVACGRW